METTLNQTFLEELVGRTKKSNAEHFKHFPGDLIQRQPVHTVYGGAHLFKANTAKRMGELAIRHLETYGKDPGQFSDALGLSRSDWLRNTVYERVMEKLHNEAVEDFRIDFEDGFGYRPDAEEDNTAIQAALEVRKGLDGNTLPPFIGIRVKSLTNEMAHRAFRTLDIFVSQLVKDGGELPKNFIVTLPKITAAEQVSIFCEALTRLEDSLLLEKDAIKLEFMVELTQTLFDSQGRSHLPAIAEAAGERLFGAHFGTYDYTASCNITAAHQAMSHPACDFARQIMKNTLSGRPIFLSDGATNIMPVGPHKATDEKPLTNNEIDINFKTVHGAWKIAYQHIRQSLELGFYQGWDLHPGQLPVRYGASYAFFLEGLEQATNRLNAFMDKATQATLLGDVFDDAATGQGLLNYFIRALSCKAITEEEVTNAGITMEELQTRSFAKIMELRTK